MSFSIFSARGANSASPNLLAGFDGSFRDGGKTGEGKKLHEGKQERKEIYGYDRRKTPPPQKKCLQLRLQPVYTFQTVDR